jgi:O-Antigen ligase
MSDRQRAAAFVLGLLSAFFAWWAIKQGAYFGTVFYPGAICCYALLFLLILYGPRGERLGRAGLIALIALLGLGMWTLLALAWTPAPGSAVGDAQRIFLYGALFALGAWARRLLGRQSLALLAPVALAGAVVGVVATATLAFGSDVSAYLHVDGTLRYPVGYRNANAAFLLLCAWPLLSLAISNATRLPLRALAIAAATMLLELALLSQSRGSVPATCVALVVFLAISRHRLRAAAVLALAVLPVLAAAPTLLTVFQHGKADGRSLQLLHESAAAIALSTLGAAILAAVALRFIYPRLNLGPRRVRLLSRACAAAALLAVLGATVAVLARHGGPIGFIDQRADELTHVGYPNLSHQPSRFGFNIGSNRGDFWRVALNEGVEHPIMGGGPGSFEIAYQRHRRSTEEPKDPHSVELLMFSELGLVGVVLFVVFLGGATASLLRGRRAGIGAATVVAGAGAAAAQWLTHSSYDWLWYYPGVTAPAIYLLGALTAPRAAGVGGDRALWARRGALAVLVVAVAITVPLFLSERFIASAMSVWRGDPRAAYSDLDSAASLNPFDAAPLLDKGALASVLGDRAVALSALKSARQLEPESYEPYYLSARELRLLAPAAARRLVEKARALNPLNPQVLSLSRDVEIAGKRR